MSCIHKNLAKAGRLLRRTIAPLVAVGAVWLLFTFVIGDARLFLDYLKVLAWPLVAVAFLSFFRSPLEDRFRHLLRIEALGASAEFSAAQGRRLQEDIEEDVDSLLGGAALDPNADDAADTSSGLEPQEGEGDDGLNGPPSPRATEVDAPPPGSEGVVDPIALEELIQLVHAFGVPPSVVEDAMKSAGGPAGQREALKGFIRGEAVRSRRLKKQASDRARETRESIEAVIQKSASWGYEMGKAGAPKAVPDVEWSDDGTWRITTEVPPVKQARRQSEPARSEDADWHRQVRALEDEIKALEKKKHGGFLPSTLVSIADDRWLAHLKTRLRSIDPGNPWTAD